jgi:hypothetical protein
LYSHTSTSAHRIHAFAFSGRMECVERQCGQPLSRPCVGKSRGSGGYTDGRLAEEETEQALQRARALDGAAVVDLDFVLVRRRWWLCRRFVEVKVKVTNASTAGWRRPRQTADTTFERGRVLGSALAQLSTLTTTSAWL